MKKRIRIIILTLTMILALAIFTGCASCQRACKDCSSDVSGGLERVIKVYTMDGTLMATYEGKFDMATREDGSIEFEYNGKRIIYYNAIVEIIEK